MNKTKFEKIIKYLLILSMLFLAILTVYLGIKFITLSIGNEDSTHNMAQEGILVALACIPVIILALLQYKIDENKKRGKDERVNKE